MTTLELIDDLRQQVRGHRNEGAVLQRISQAEKSLRARFAQLNGWAVAKGRFSVDDLRDGRIRAGAWWEIASSDHDALDHVEHYRDRKAPHRPAAIVSHIYSSPGAAEAFAKEHRLEAHVAGSRMVSWYYPGGTWMVVYVRPGTAVAWLPEQVALWYDARKR